MHAPTGYEEADKGTRGIYVRLAMPDCRGIETHMKVSVYCRPPLELVLVPFRPL